MKTNILTLLLLSVFCLSANAQDDDMYSFSSKKKAQGTTTTTQPKSSAGTYSEDEGDADADYHTGQLRDVDEYNRRYSTTPDGTASYQLKGDTLYVSSAPSEGYNEGYSDGYYDGLYDGDFTYTSRLHAIASVCMTHSSGTSLTGGTTPGMTPGTDGMLPIIATAMPAGTTGDGAGAGDGTILTTMQAGTTDGIILRAVAPRPAAIWDSVRQPSTAAGAVALAMVG